MTNSTQKKMKEDMVISFVKKMTSQVRKHNKRYLQTKLLVHTVFSECQTGQVVAQFLKGRNDEAFLPFRNPTTPKCTGRRSIVRSCCYF
jgi:hypothetical protein